MNAKIRDFANQKVPYILVMGDKEAEAHAVSVRTRAKGDQGSMPLATSSPTRRSLLKLSQPICRLWLDTSTSYI
jgi:threonyl-tRNA synthetase